MFPPHLIIRSSIAEIILYPRYFSFKLRYPNTGPVYYNAYALVATYLLPRRLNLMDESGERTLNLKIVKVLAKMVKCIQVAMIKMATYDKR